MLDTWWQCCPPFIVGPQVHVKVENKREVPLSCHCKGRTAAVMRWHRQMPALTLRDLANIRKWLDDGAENQIENRENLKGDIFDNERSTYRSNGKTCLQWKRQ